MLIQPDPGTPEPGTPEGQQEMAHGPLAKQFDRPGSPVALGGLWEGVRGLGDGCSSFFFEISSEQIY